MPHVREIIRDAVVTVVTGLDTTGSNVGADRVNPYRTLPALNVTTLDEVVREDLGSMEGISDQIRELRLVIDGFAKETDTPNDTLDTIADEVEEAVLNSSDLDDLAWDLTLESTSFEYTRDGSNPIGRVEVVFSFLYQVDGTDPSNIS